MLQRFVGLAGIAWVLAATAAAAANDDRRHADAIAKARLTAEADTLAWYCKFKLNEDLWTKLQLEVSGDIGRDSLEDVVIPVRVRIAHLVEADGDRTCRAGIAKFGSHGSAIEGLLLSE